MDPIFENPFRPGAGHRPPYLAGRTEEQSEFKRLLSQSTILENLVLTGLRGVGKTVLLETFKPIAESAGWLWVAQDLSESASVNEECLATRILTDLSLTTAGILRTTSPPKMGFSTSENAPSRAVTFQDLIELYRNTPGLVQDKLKAVLETVWKLMPKSNVRGIVFAYDETQNLADHSKKEEYPLSLLLDVFQSVQRKGIPFMLILTGLPTLFPKLVEARTYSERMFHVLFLKQLNNSDSTDAIRVPVEQADSPVKFNAESVARISSLSAGYPYFIQFICREVFDIWTVQLSQGQEPTVPVEQILRKLDNDFFAGRWAKATDRQRDLLWIISLLPEREDEFTVQEVVRQSRKTLEKPFSGSHVSQMLVSLSNAGLIYKNRHGKYSFAVPLFAQFIRRQISIPLDGLLDIGRG